MKLIIGYGNSLRLDDGVGWAVIEALQQANLPTMTCLAVHQLTPELSENMSLADMVILIDASVEGQSGDVKITPVIAHADAPAMTHHLSPQGLLAMTHWLYDMLPFTVLITITGADFGVGEGLSDVVKEKADLLVKFIQGMCAS
ncbi:MAG: hydrogenase maturation protease [bacterium]|nr:hydrogenase maturation protease [bacterium]